MLAAAEYTLKSELTDDNRLKHTLTHRSGIIKEDSRSWKETFTEETSNEPCCGPLHLEIYFYLREASKLRDTDIKRADIINFLERYQGVRIYRDGMRVKPYGDPRDDRDWLGLNASKAGSPEAVTGRLGQYRVWGNQIVGSIRVSRIQNPELRDQTNREGLIENRAYWDIRRFILHGIRFLEYERQIYEKELKQAEKTPVFQQVVSEVEEELESHTAAVEKDINESALVHPVEMEALKVLKGTKPMVTKLRKAHEEEIAELMSENQLLTGLATLGIALVVFGHETSQSINALIARSKLLSSTIATLPDDLRNKLQNDISGLSTAIQRVESWGQFALNHVRRDKRTSQNLDVNGICVSVFDGFSSLLDSRSIKIVKHYDPDIPKLRGFAMDIEGIVINLITNSIEALRPTPLEKRTISITTEFDRHSSQLSLIFTDSGKGILEQDIGKIFQPLFTTKTDRDGQPTGTGMGLKIIKNIVEQYNGKIEAKGHGDFGGAVFCIYIPTPT
jgi:signal transduction histidine kinase